MNAAATKLLANLFITYTLVMHFFWGFMLAIFPEVGGTVAVYHIREFLLGSQYLTALSLMLVAVLSLTALVLKTVQHRTISVFLMIPQQFVLGLTAVGAAKAMLLGHYADGYVAPTAFIVADQAGLIILAVLHLFAIFHQWKYK